jgi:hypothetical protein
LRTGSSTGYVPAGTSKSASSRELVTGRSGITSLALDARNLYFLGPRGPMRVSHGGGASVPMAEGPGTALAVDDQAVYWLTSGSVMQLLKR